MLQDSTTSFLNISSWYIDRQLLELREYVLAMERLIADELAQEEAALSDKAKSVSEPDRAQFIYNNSDYALLVSDTFTNRLRLSSITLAHAIFERRLVSLAKLLGKNSPLKIGDLTGNSPIQKSKRYLHIVIGVDLSSINWDSLKNWSKLRNVIAHADGQFTEDDRGSLKILADKYPGDLNLEHNQIVASHQLVHHFIEELQGVSGQLSKQLSVWNASRSP